jgi:hypothetical protein
MREHASYIFVEVQRFGEPDVAHHSACCRRARMPVPRGTSLRGSSLRATDPTRGNGRRRLGANQRHTVRSGESQAGFRSKRHRQLLQRSAAPLQYTDNHSPPGASGAGTLRRADLLSRRVTADHQRAGHRIETQNTPSPARPPRGQLVHGDLPGVLAPLDQGPHVRVCGGRVTKKFTAELGARDRKPCGPTRVRTHRAPRPVPGSVELDGRNSPRPDERGNPAYDGPAEEYVEERNSKRMWMGPLVRFRHRNAIEHEQYGQ